MKNIVLFSIALLSFSCQNKTETAPVEATKSSAPATQLTLTPEQVKNAGIISGKAETREIKTSLLVNGVVEAAPGNLVSVVMPYGGYVKQLRLLPGSRVRKGEVLAVMEDPQYIQLQEDYLVARNRLAFLDTDYQRQKELNADKTSSDKTFQQVSTDFGSQKILVRSLEEKLLLLDINPATLTEKTLSRSVKVYSPLTGYVSNVYVNTGKYVSPTDVLFDLTNPSDMHLSLTVFEKDVAVLLPGQKVMFTVNNEGEKKMEAEIYLVNRSINADRSTEIHCRILKNYDGLVPGMFVNAVIELQSLKALAVPDEAIVKWENKNYVFTESANNTYTMSPVADGLSSGGFTTVNQDFANSKIVIKNPYSILMKLRNDED